MLTSLVAGLALALGQVDTPVPGNAAPQPLPLGQPTQNQRAPITRVYVQAPGAAAPAATDATPATNGKAPDAPKEAPKENGNGNGGDAPKYGPAKTFLRAYPTLLNWFPKTLGKEEKKPGEEEPEPPPPPRRGFAAPFASPPFPGGGEWQASPVPGQPLTPESDYGPLTQALHSIEFAHIGDFLKDNRIRVYGWVNASTNWSTNKTSNLPDSYWLSANRLNLNQFVLKVEREVDSVQTDHIDVGFRSCVLYGEDYRFTTAGGWGINQYAKNNLLYGWDPIEQYVDVYVPGIAQGMIFRIGRWVACPDIETQLAPDNYLVSHSILFTYDTYTQTGFEFTFKLSDQWLVQAGLNCGDDMAPWYKGATVSGFFGARWISADNKDSIYTCLNQINNAEFRHFDIDGQAAGHDNYNYVVSTWQHKFTDKFLTKTEGYFMWQHDAELGGTPSIGPLQPYGGGGGDGTLLPGWSYTYGLLNYTCWAPTKTDFLTLRNEVWRDERGMRSGFPGTYTSTTIGLTHQFTNNLEIRPEVGYYRNWTNPAFDLGAQHGAVIAGLDVILRF
jgi:hypothetical protein